MPFNENLLRKIKPGARRRIVTETGVSPDLRGLQMWVYPSGSKTFFARFKVNSQTFYEKLGDFPETGLAEAHQKLQALRAELRAGRNPVTRKRAARAPDKTVATLADEFLKRYCRNLVPKRINGEVKWSAAGPERRKSWREVERILNKDVLPEWKKRQAAAIEARDVVELLDGITDRGSPIAANRTYAVIKQMFKYGVGRGFLYRNPCGDVHKPLPKEPTRERVLNNDEIKQLWERLPTSHMAPVMRNIYRLILMTGARPGEVTRAEWSEFDLDNALWTIPATKTKSAREHQVPLPDMAVELLQEMRRQRDEKEPGSAFSNSRWLFPARDGHEDKPIEDKAAAHAVRNNSEHFGLPRWTPHDLRRTVRSKLSELGVNPIVAKKVLNHALEGMDRIYDRHDYADEKGKALQTWAAHLQDIIEGRVQKVVPLPRNRKAS